MSTLMPSLFARITSPAFDRGDACAVTSAQRKRRAS